MYDVFDQCRGDILAGRKNDYLLLAAGDFQKSVVIQFAEIAGLQPTVFGEHFRGFLRFFVIAGKHHRAFDEYLTIATRSYFAHRHRFSYCAEFEIVGPIERDADVLGQTVRLKNRHAGIGEKLCDLSRERSTAGSEQPNTSAECIFDDLRIDIFGSCFAATIAA